MTVGVASWTAVGPLRLTGSQQAASSQDAPAAVTEPAHEHSSAPAAPAGPEPTQSAAKKSPTRSASPSSSSHQGNHPKPVPGDYVLAENPVTGVTPSTKTPPRKAHREFQANCSVSHRRDDDPIVFFNKPGASHNHTFMGNTTTKANSTTESLLAGSTLCRVPGDRSGYWMPTVFDGDRAIEPTGPQVIYYKSGVRDYTSVRPFPVGLRYLVGSPTTTAEQFAKAPGYQKGWECGDSYDNVDFPATCRSGSQLNIRMQAPSCWDGKHLDTPDHISHIVYPVDGVCPKTHPVAVPMLEFKMAFPVSGDMSKVRLASGRGFTFHYDFYNAWDAPTLNALVTHCINAGRQCDARGYSQFEPEAGAALDEHYQVPGSRKVLDRGGWTATASGVSRGSEPAKMLDGDPRSRFTSGTPMVDGQSVTVDMRSARSVSGISLLSNGSDYARRYQVYLSNDGSNWGSPVASGPGAETIAADFAPRNARYIRVVQTGSASNWWSVAEFVAFTR
ncbi:DUF1996 domain-containing protein [Micromonospora yangpuensis]|uniref:DUF1996 domain-containing protein n=1 Tax=Micromonospora yangpuensis TaxID=683228 RepID=UPI001E605AC8|nr:DUF1996 domain-containing protein [Micromonospora yangpuensis]